MDKDLLEKLRPHSFTKYIAFNRLSIIQVEAFFHAIKDNPYFEKNDLNEYFADVTVMIDTYEGWHDVSKVLISDEKIIDEILKQSAAKVIRYRDLLADFIEEEKNYTNEDLKNLIELFDKAAIDVYKENFLLNEDVLHTENPLYLEELPQMRLKISDEFVTPLWEAYKKILSCMCINTDTAIEVLENLTTDELLAFLDGDASMKERGKLNRPVAFVVVNNTVSIITDEKVFEISDFLAKQDTDAKNIESAKSEGVVSGKTAYKGKVSGPVVVLRESDYPKAREILEKKENYILVTPMTRPEIAMYFSKALAFVTDEGGITCHAAIVAREMKKPCVISTKFATKVFVDGDIVEVDAEKGIVRVIK